ncbi:MAG: ABC transporter permease [Desulfobacteraceae bacterium]|nr:ABC transporter permease [Desulfobacteraceae bacterium]
MLFNYIKIAFRNLLKNKTFSLINISGLAIGMTCCFLILIWVLDEFSFDRFHKNSADIYRVICRIKSDNDVNSTSWSPLALGPALMQEYPEVIDFTRCTLGERSFLRHGDAVFTEKIFWVDPSFFRIFSFKTLEGNLDEALNSPTSLVITRRIAKKYFGTDRNIVGKVLKLNNRSDFKINAVIEDVPANSHIEFDIMGPISILRRVGYDLNSWSRYVTMTYLQLQKNVSYQEVNQKIAKIIENHQGSFTYSVDIEMQPLTDIHLYSDFKGERAKVGSIANVYILSIIAALILIIACINFMNLSTARSSNRLKEIGIRKVVGALRSQLLAQFYGESIFFAVLALVFSLALVKLLLPPFNTLSGKALTLGLASGWQVIITIGLITLFTGIIAGSYPAYYLSSLLPGRVLKGGAKSGTKSVLVRKVLVVFQFSVSIFLIICTTVIHSQIRFIKNKDLGYEKNNVLMIPMPSRHTIGESHQTLKNQLLINPGVMGVAATTLNPTNMERSSMTLNWRGKDPDAQITIHYNVVTIGYLDTLKMEVIEGRGFSEEISSDRNGAALLNEEAVKEMGFENPVGEMITIYGTRKLRVIGVLRNFHFRPVHKKIEPMIIATGPVTRGYTMIKLSGDRMRETIGFIKKVWQTIYPQILFDYHFLEEDYDRLYRTEERIGTLLNYFSALTVFVACLGLFGLASFATKQKTKEIGIRKVLGASVSNIILLLSKDFLKLVVIANILAWPLAYYFTNSWLQNFAYRTSINWLFFILSGILSLLIALFTVSIQSAKAAIANPIESLRYE